MREELLMKGLVACWCRYCVACLKRLVVILTEFVRKLPRGETCVSEDMLLADRQRECRNPAMNVSYSDLKF